MGHGATKFGVQLPELASHLHPLPAVYHLVIQNTLNFRFATLRRIGIKNDLALLLRDGLPLCLTDSTWPWCPVSVGINFRRTKVRGRATLNDIPPLLPHDGFTVFDNQALKSRIPGYVLLVEGRLVCLNVHPRFLVAKNDLLLLLFNEVFPKLAKSFVLSGSR